MAETCPTCHNSHYHGEPCPTCFHQDLERKFSYANQTAKDCPKCGVKRNYILVVNSFTIKIKPECGCFGKPRKEQHG